MAVKRPKPIDQKVTEAPPKKGNALTDHVKIIGFGENNQGFKFVKLSIDGRGSVLARIDNMTSNKASAFEKLNQQWAHLYSQPAQNELINRIQALGQQPSTFKVADKIGLFDDCFILPDRAIPALTQGVEICLNDIPGAIIARYKTKGTPEGWQELARYGIGNSRLMFAFALNFVGPLSEIWPRQFVAFQFTGDGGCGKSSIAAVCTSTWGWDPRLNIGKKYGFGTSWNTTNNNLESLCGGYNETILFIDETGVSDRKPGAPVDNLDAIMRLDGQMEKGRLTDQGSGNVWNMPVLSTSNISVPQMIRARPARDSIHKVDHRVLCDRLIDIPTPCEGFGMYESLHGFRDEHEFSAHLKGLASDHHGRAARTFIHRLMAKRTKDPQALLSFLNAGELEYKAESEVKIAASQNVPRLRDKFATVYAAGCLAIAEKIVPYKRNDLLQAVLTCERDHIDFVDKELGGSSPRKAAFDLLCAYIKKNRDEFVDLKKSMLPLAPNHDHRQCIGYKIEINGRREYLFAEERFVDIAGDQKRANELKSDLLEKKLIATAPAGEGTPRYAVKRPIGGGKRKYVVAISADICGED
jgi:hypothetical protein